MTLLDFSGDYGSDIRPPRVGAGRKAWAKDPTGAAGTDGTRIDATLLNDLVGLVRATLAAFSIVASAGDDTALAQAITAAIGAGTSGFAPIDSPELTGTPLAPTADPGTNSTQLATTAFVAAAVAALVNSSPSTLDTLKELADALGDDPNFATTIATALGLKAPLASPALTGTPTAPTAAPGTNNTQIATTAFVVALMAASGVASFNSRTGAISPANDDYAVTMLAAIAANSFVGNNTGAPTRPIVLTAGQAKALLSLTKGDVGLGNVDNTADVSKPVSTAQQTALNSKMGAPDVQVEEQQVSGTDGGTFTSGAWQTRVLNTLVRNNGSLASLASNQVTLPAGTYYAEWRATGQVCGTHQTRLMNVTDSAVLGNGCNMNSSTADFTGNDSAGRAVFTLSGSKAISVQHRCTNTKSGTGFGSSTGFNTEIYAQLWIWKLS